MSGARGGCVATALVAVALACASHPALAVDCAPPCQAHAVSDAALETLLLDVTVNGRRVPGIARAERTRRGTLRLAADAWTAARLRPPAISEPLHDGTDAYALDRVDGLHYALDSGALTLSVTAPAEAFVAHDAAAGAAARTPPPRPAPGGYVNYEAALARGPGDARRHAGLAAEAVAFGPFGTFVTSGMAADDGRARRAARLDTWWQLDFPAAMQVLTVGDTAGAGAAWSAPQRYAGIRWQRDFGLQPGYVTMPRLPLGGAAVLPSTVEVLVNDMRLASVQVPPGPFDLGRVPVVAGAGDVRIVVRDALGRERVVTQPYYASPRLLADGLVDWSVEAGWLRRGHGDDGGYAQPYAAAGVRRGVGDALTAGIRMESAAARRIAGIELAAVVGRRVALDVGAAALREHGVERHLLGLGVERSTPAATFGARVERASRSPASRPEAAAALPPRSRVTAAASGRIGHAGTTFSYVRQSGTARENLERAGVGLGLPLGRRAHLGAHVHRRLDGDRAWAAGLALHIPLDGRTTATATAARPPRGAAGGGVAIARHAATGERSAWRVEASTFDHQRAAAGLQLRGDAAEGWLALAADARGAVVAQAGLRGSFGVLGGEAFAAPAIGAGGFALVQTGGVEGVPVRVGHVVAAHTDARGRAVVVGLPPWLPASIEIDPGPLPFDAVVGDLVQQRTVRARSGVVVRFEVRRARQALLVLTQPDGRPVPVGAEVRLLPDGAAFHVGLRGEVWLTDLAPDEQRLEVHWGAQRCRLAFALPSDDGLPPTIGPLVCGGGMP